MRPAVKHHSANHHCANPAVAGHSSWYSSSFCRLTLGPKLNDAEEPDPDHEGHGRHPRRRQSGQSLQHAPLSGCPAGLPARATLTSPPTLIGVTADLNIVQVRRGVYLCIVAIRQWQPAAASLLRGGPGNSSGLRDPGPRRACGYASPAPSIPGLDRRAAPGAFSRWSRRRHPRPCSCRLLFPALPISLSRSPSFRRSHSDLR